MSTIRVVVYVSGGLVQAAYSPDWPDAEVCVVDWDALETAEDEEPMSSTSPVDDWEQADPILKKIVEAVSGGTWLSVRDVRALLEE